MNYHQRNSVIARHEDDALNRHLKNREYRESPEDTECQECGAVKQPDMDLCQECFDVIVNGKWLR